MKLYRFLAVALVAATVFSCKKENKKETEKEVVKSEVDGYQLAKEIADEQYSVEIYTLSGKFKKGYNDLFVRVKNKTGNTYEKAAQVTITPVMDMGTMQHSCPVSSFDKMTSKMYVYSGFAIFQMASMTADDWKLSVRLIVNNQSIDLDGTITVDNVSRVNVTTFTGTDNAKYVLALVDPVQPKVGLNVISARLFQMENMMTFTEKNNYKIKIDPRMPSMGNHGSPNNADLMQANGTGLYKGQLSLTMTGYWKINLQLLNAQEEVLKGEEVSNQNESSSIYFEVEF